MYKFSIAIILLLFQETFAQKGNLKTLAHIDKKLHEISGMEKFPDSPLIWGVNDAGNKNIVYGFDENGKILKEVEIENAKNKDWEDLARDDQGTLYIGDFGNNANKRKDLVIYKVKNFLKQGEKAKAEEIKFSFEDQTDFPPDKKHRNFGVESFIFKDNHLYLFTKNRSKSMDGTVKLYRLPITPGNFTAKKIDAFKTCDHNKNDCWITSATTNPSRDVIYLLSNTQVWRLSKFEDEAFFDGKVENFSFGDYTQKESILYRNTNSVFISDEETKHHGGRNLYSFRFPSKNTSH